MVAIVWLVSHAREMTLPPIELPSSDASSLGNSETLARLLGMPAFPLVATIFPYPVRYHIYFGEPMEFHGNHNEEDVAIGTKVEQVKQRIHDMLQDGLQRRTSIFF